MGKLPSIAVMVAAAALQINAQTRGAGQAVPKATVTRIAEHPNLNGLWQALTEANWDIRAHNARPGPPQFGALFSEPASVGIVDGGEIPYQPWAAEKQRENFNNRWTSD